MALTKYQFVHTIKSYRQNFELSFDEVKSCKNELERGLPFACAAEFDFDGALMVQDHRQEYSETRIVALGYLHQRLHVLVFKPMANGIRVISLRKANQREINRYTSQIATD